MPELRGVRCACSCPGTDQIHLHFGFWLFGGRVYTRAVTSVSAARFVVHHLHRPEAMVGGGVLSPVVAELIRIDEATARRLRDWLESPRAIRSLPLEGSCDLRELFAPFAGQLAPDPRASPLLPGRRRELPEATQLALRHLLVVTGGA